MATVLDKLLSTFSVETARNWLRQTFDSFDSSQSKMLSIDENKNDKKFFASARILGYIRELPESCENDTNRPVLVAAVEMKNDLTERTSRQTQFNFAKRTLQEAVRSGSAGLNGYPSQGIFFFYDKDQFFRISLVSAAVEGKRFKFNEAKRQSFYINPDRPNNVARSRLQGAIRTFADLKNAFSVETLTKEFYKRLFAWYEWAMKPGTGVSFPNVLGDSTGDRKYNNEAIIRLITRLMFVWFIRQRGLVPEDCFTVKGVSSLLKEFNPTSMEVGNYYHCILQNLFFATLNCQPEDRRFRERSGNNSCSGDWGIKTRYRYKKEFKDSAEFMQMMQQVPFLNCALFDCLDKEERKQDGGRNLLFDGFSDVKCRQAHMPNGLFFHPEKGIITLFDAYEFTIDENNADDADVALDPELLGKVFENLLGAFNPETSTTARNATGSFYTPREIVDYMVEESLKNYLKTKVPALTPEWLEDLFDKTKAVDGSKLPFDDSIAGKVREALYTCKILDPACGSGAFPMGILHCMVRLFERLDPNNRDLNDRLIARYKRDTALPSDPYETKAEREERLDLLEKQLKEGMHYPNYARKLYLIENCIYGVDIQPIATQISKLRFFISLLCDQLRTNWNENRENHGLLSLPNLEAKFVCANTLIALPDTEGELALHSANIPRLREQLQENRHQIFTAPTYLKKNKLKAKDLEIRDKIREAVRATLAKPDKKLIAIQKEVIEKLTLDRKAYEKPKMVKLARPVQTSLFDDPEQSELKYEMVDANQAKRDEIDTQIHFAQKKIDSEMDKSKAENVTAIDKLATMVAGWDPYDQNATSSFFDAKWMFNIKDGFDVVIGNPPYVSTKGILEDDKKRYELEFGFSDDTYNLFTFKGVSLLKQKGSLSYIIPKTFWTTQTKRNMRDLLLSYQINYIFDTANPFETVMVDTCVIQMTKSPLNDGHVIKFLDGTKDLDNPKSLPPISQKVFGDTQNAIIFMPTKLNCKTYELYGRKVKELHSQWWEKIETSAKISKNKNELDCYRADLQSGDVALLGCLTEGGQGLATANNGKYIAVRASTKWAGKIIKSRSEKLAKARKKFKITIPQMSRFKNEKDFLNSLTENEIWQLFDNLKRKYGRDIFGQGYIYRIINDDEVVNVDELTTEEKLNGIDMSKKHYVPYDKGDKDGNRWFLETPFAIAWTKENVGLLKTDSRARFQGYVYYFREGLCWSDIAKENLKCRKKEKSIHDVKSMSVFSLTPLVPDYYLTAIINSTFIGLYGHHFVNNTQTFQINDARQLPIIIPSKHELEIVKSIFNRAVALKKKHFSGEMKDEEAERQLDAVQKELDAFVYKLYGFSEEVFAAEDRVEVSGEKSSRRVAQPETKAMSAKIDDDEDWD